MLMSSYEVARKEFYKRRGSLNVDYSYESDSYDCRREKDYDDDDADCFCD